jgi:hypothetical protein
MSAAIPTPPPLSESYVRDRKWLQENLASLVNKYPDQWIAVLGGRVVAAARGLGEVESAVERLHPGAEPVYWLVERHPSATLASARASHPSLR